MRSQSLEYVSDDGTVVPCCSFGAKNAFKEPVKRSQVIICHACRQRQQIRTNMGKLKPFPVIDIYSMHKKEEKK